MASVRAQARRSRSPTATTKPPTANASEVRLITERKLPMGHTVGISPTQSFTAKRTIRAPSRVPAPRSSCKAERAIHRMAKSDTCLITRSLPEVAAVFDLAIDVVELVGFPQEAQ